MGHLVEYIYFEDIKKQWNQKVIKHGMSKVYLPRYMSVAYYTSSLISPLSPDKYEFIIRYKYPPRQQLFCTIIDPFIYQSLLNQTIFLLFDFLYRRRYNKSSIEKNYLLSFYSHIDIEVPEFKDIFPVTRETPFFTDIEIFIGPSFEQKMILERDTMTKGIFQFMRYLLNNQLVKCFKMGLVLLAQDQLMPTENGFIYDLNDFILYADEFSFDLESD